MLAGMAYDKWYNEDTMPPIGTELFRSTRRFQLWEQTVSHGQLLFRATRKGPDPRIDLLFKPVRVMRLHTAYDGLVVRLAEQSGSTYRFELESGDIRDFVVTYAFGWHEDNGAYGDPSEFAESLAPYRRSALAPHPYVHVVMLRVATGAVGPLGAYLTRGEAEQALTARPGEERWIETVPVQL